MNLPPLYKYLNVRGAKLTLGNRTFKHAKPSDFNDTEDLTIQSIFPEAVETALKRLEHSFLDVILQHLNDPPTCNSPRREQILLIQQAFRANPKNADMAKAEWAKEEGKPIYNVEHMRALADTLLKDINEFMQGWRVLCVTTHRNSEEMWSGYAENHKGIALRIEPNLIKDSKFQRFRPVIYHEKRPALYDDTLELIAGGLFGDKEERIARSINKIIYSKTLNWQHENEYRLAIPVMPTEEPWNTKPYHPEEITELYLGLAMEIGDMDEIIGLARSVNPNIMIFGAKREAHGEIGFDRVQ